MNFSIEPHSNVKYSATPLYRFAWIFKQSHIDYNNKRFTYQTHTWTLNAFIQRVLLKLRNDWLIRVMPISSSVCKIYWIIFCHYKNKIGKRKSCLSKINRHIHGLPSVCRLTICCRFATLNILLLFFLFFFLSLSIFLLRIDLYPNTEHDEMLNVRFSNSFLNCWCWCCGCGCCKLKSELDMCEL